MTGSQDSTTGDDLAALVAARVGDRARLAAVSATGMLDTPSEPAFDRIARLAARLLATPLAFVTFVDDRRSFWKACVGVDSATRENDVGESFCQYVIGLDEAFLVDDARLDRRTADNPSIEAMGVRAWAGVPVRDGGGHVLGTVCAVDTEPRAWTPDDAQILTELAAVAAGEVSAVATAAAGQRAEALLEAIIERAPLGFCLVDEELRFEMVNDVLAKSNGLSAEAHLGRSVSEVLSRDGAPIIDALRDIIAGRRDAIEVDIQGETPGRPGHRAAFHASYFRVDVGDATSRVAALVTDETERSASRRRAEILAELSRKLADAEDLAAIGAAVHDLAGEYVGASIVTLTLAEQPSRHLVVVPARRSAPDDAVAPRLDNGAHVRALEDGLPVSVENRADHRRRFPDAAPLDLPAGAEAAVFLPMSVGSGPPVGVISFGWRHTITNDELPFPQIDTVVDVITQSVARVRASQERRELIAGLQDIVLAEPPTRPGLRLAVRYVPAATALGFGGDWYDVVALDDDRSALIVGDVVGHDAAAAARMTEARALLRQLLLLGTPLDRLFDRARAFTPVAGSSALATTAVVVVDPSARKLSAASAGHVPPLLVDEAGEVRRLPLGLGPFLGVEGVHEQPRVTAYEPGSTLVLYSDGLVETRAGDIGADIDRLADALAGIHGDSCAAVATALVDEFVDRRSLVDDVALIVARL